jgi:hypothetical protein
MLSQQRTVPIVSGAAMFLTRIAHRPVADFVRSRAVAGGYGQNSHEFYYTGCRAFSGAGA